MGVSFDISVEDIERQLKLEQEGITDGINRYRQMRIDAIHHGGDMTQLQPEFRLMQETVEPVAKAIVMTLTGGQGNKTKARRWGKVMETIRAIEPFELAYLTVRHCLQIVSDVPLQYTAVELGTMVEKHIDYCNFRQEKPAYLKAVVIWGRVIWGRAKLSIWTGYLGTGQAKHL